MKKIGILNSELSKLISDLGHTDMICISDIGLPVPNGVKKIDLALDYKKPSFIEVFDILSRYVEIEKVTLANEIKKNNQNVHDYVINHLEDQNVSYLTHEEFKELTKNCKAIIRTGENTPYANIILHSGVFFSS
jgi:D-ribose pyranase